MRPEVGKARTMCEDIANSNLLKEIIAEFGKVETQTVIKTDKPAFGKLQKSGCRKILEADAKLKRVFSLIGSLVAKSARPRT